VRHDSISRRELLRLGAGGLLAAGLWPGTLRAADKATEPFDFIAVNDLHYIDAGCGEWLAGVVKQMKAHPNVAFCLVGGDLVEGGTPEQLAGVREVLKGLGLPYYAVVGNHDWRTQTDRKPYEEHFPDRINYHFGQGGWQFVCLDTSDGVRYAKTAVQPATLKWLDDTLPKLDRSRPTVVLTHFPLGPDVTNRPTNAEEVLKRFVGYNLRAAFSGHYHAFTEKKVGEAVLTTNRCCALKRNNHDRSKEKGYFVCKAKDGKVERTFVEVKPG
jgi:3',5'-cyclic AMP phosphodiesterase CpdA